jgi:hypothetical protein
MPEHRRPRGRIRPEAYPNLRYAHTYLAAPLPEPTYPVDVTENIGDWGMAGNDLWGDCVAAAEWHYEMSTAGAAGVPLPGATSPVPVERYCQASGATSPPGPGLVISTYCGWLYKRGVIKAYAPVDHRNRATADAFMQAGFGLLAGVCLTTTAEAEFNTGTSWGAGRIPLPNLTDGHGILRVRSLGPTPTAGVTYVTWGKDQDATGAWERACLEELWLLVTSEEALAKFEPQLLADVQALHGVG